MLLVGGSGGRVLSGKLIWDRQYILLSFIIFFHFLSWLCECTNTCCIILGRKRNRFSFIRVEGGKKISGVE